MDLIISVDTSIYLSGALNKKGWLLLAFTPDYRWLLDQKIVHGIHQQIIQAAKKR